MSQRHAFTLALAATLAAGLSAPAAAQQTIKIGELNSYKAVPAFLDPYKKGWEMAVEEINAKGGVLGKKLEVVSRDDGANPGEAGEINVRTNHTVRPDLHAFVHDRVGPDLDRGVQLRPRMNDGAGMNHAGQG